MNEHYVTSEDTALCTLWTEICQSPDETLQDTHTVLTNNQKAQLQSSNLQPKTYQQRAVSQNNK